MDRGTSEGEGRRWPNRTGEGGRPRAPGRRGSDSRAGLHPGPGSGHCRHQTHRRHQPNRLSQKLASRQASIAQPTFRIQDLQLGRAAGRPKSVACDADLRPLADHVPAKPNPRPTTQLQPQRRDLNQDARQGRGKVRWLQHQELNTGSTRKRSQSVESLGQDGRRKPGSAQWPIRQVQQQQIDGSILQQHCRHSQRFLERDRREDDEPLELDPASNRLYRVKASGKIQIRHDPAGRLGLSHGLKRQRRLAAGPFAVDGSGCSARQPAQSEDRIQGPKAGRDGSIRRARQTTRYARQPLRAEVRTRPWRYSQRAHDLGSPRWASYTPARSCPTPAIPEGRESRLYLGRRGRHGMSIIERMFYQSRPDRRPGRPLSRLPSCGTLRHLPPFAFGEVRPPCP
jgi:hypothetical protein